MKIKWNGHSSFTITAADGTVLVTDPYDPNGYGGALQYARVTDRADGVVISHDHSDYNTVPIGTKLLSEYSIHNLPFPGWTNAKIINRREFYETHYIVIYRVVRVTGQS